jgi:hypothetical protein
MLCDWKEEDKVFSLLMRQTLQPNDQQLLIMTSTSFLLPSTTTIRYLDPSMLYISTVYFMDTFAQIVKGVLSTNENMSNFPSPAKQSDQGLVGER